MKLKMSEEKLPSYEERKNNSREVDAGIVEHYALMHPSDPRLKSVTLDSRIGQLILEFARRKLGR